VTRGLLRLRGLPLEVRAWLDNKPSPRRDLDSMPLTEVDRFGWINLGEEPGREIVVGAVGRFWGASIEWRSVEPSAFAAFDEPGNAKIAWSFTVLPYGVARSVLATECRTAATDEEARRGFTRYWRVVGPFAGHVIGANLPVVKRHAEEAASRE
jgi:hypothetical protein